MMDVYCADGWCKDSVWMVVVGMDGVGIDVLINYIVGWVVV